MRLRAAAVCLAAAISLAAQMKMSVNQLIQFLQSSVQLKHDDRRVAAYVKKISLRERLDDRTIEDLQGIGVGSRTIEALQALRDASKTMPPPMIDVPKPKPPAIPPPNAAEIARALAGAREFALNYTKQLPNFICTQVTRRFGDPTGMEFWQKMDVITAKLTFFEQKEDYKVVLVNSQPVDNRDIHEVGGASSAGEFGTMVKEIFEPGSAANFEWARWTTLRGRRNHVFGFQIAQARSKRSVTYEKTQSIISGYHGFVFVDAETFNVNRVKVEQELPPSFPVQQASVEMDYDMVDLGGGNVFLLPLKHTMRMRMAKMLVKNEAEFRMYRKFGAEASITFETPEPLPEDKTSEQPLK
jgi:hypothetical protein